MTIRFRQRMLRVVVVTAMSIIVMATSSVAAAAAAAVATNEQLPVLIVGAGPCGLVAATTLQKHGIPFVIIEKASRKKVCSNAGSGFELASTAIGILKDRLSIDTSKIMSHYVGVVLMTIGGMNIRNTRMPENVMLASVNRADLQKHLLDEVIFPGIGYEKKQKENGVLICGYSIDSYTEEGGDENDGRVVATLVSDDGEKKTITGCALLACDGINSRCRTVMHGGGSNDPLQFCNAIFYWGKTPMSEGSELEKEVLKTQKFHKDGGSFVFAIPTSKIPGGFFVFPTKNSKVLAWAIVVRTNDPPTSNISTKNNNDSTRRGGGVLTEEGKERLFPSSGSSTLLGIGNNLPILRKIIENTPANDITEACLFDRENLDLPFSSQKKRVALLGDAAHPQSPMLGQGVNMAITDAYICATRIAFALKNKNKEYDGTSSIPSAITSFDTSYRREQSKKVVKQSRSIQNLFLSSNPLICWFFRLYCRFASMSEFTNQVESFDKSNREFLQVLDNEYDREEQLW